MESNDPYLNHWADQAAAKTLAAHPNAQVITVAAGITPSGVVHVGNFREVMTVDLVARALRDRGGPVGLGVAGRRGRVCTTTIGRSSDRVLLTGADQGEHGEAEQGALHEVVVPGVGCSAADCSAGRDSAGRSLRTAGTGSRLATRTWRFPSAPSVP